MNLLIDIACLILLLSLSVFVLVISYKCFTED